MPELVFSIYTAVFGALVFIFGAVIGSFLNVVAYRTPIKESLIKGRSHCTSCGEQIKNRDLIPILSWIFLGGKCRSCKAHISFRYPLIELLTGLSYLAAYLILGSSFELLFALVLFPILMILSLIDIDCGEIPYWCSISIAVLGGLSFLLPDSMPWYEHLIGAVIIAVPFGIFAFLGAMGGGDVQLVAAAGLLLGWKIVPAAVIGVVVGAIFGLLIKFIKKTDKISFGPYLAFGIAVGYLLGTPIIEWYVGLIR